MGNQVDTRIENEIGSLKSEAFFNLDPKQLPIEWSYIVSLYTHGVGYLK